MDTGDLKREAQKAWVEYAEAIKGVFGFEGDIIAGPLIHATKSNDKQQITDFIAYVKLQTQNLKKMRGV